MPRLLRFRIMNDADSPFTDGRSMRRVSSPPGSVSTLITSAPRSASIMPQVGPAMIWRELEHLHTGERTAHASHQLIQPTGPRLIHGT